MNPAPGKASIAKSSDSGTAWRGCLSCVGCGCVIPLACLALLVAAAIFFLPQFSGATSRDAVLPRPVEITREDRWSLQDKLAAAPAQGAVMKLDLTLPELNLLLSKIDVKPAAGFALNRTWAFLSSGTLSIVLDGSGFWMRKLNVVLHLESAARGFRIAGMRFAGYDVPGFVLQRVGVPWLERWLGGAAGITVDLNAQTEYGFSIVSDIITLTGPFPWLRTSPTGEGR
ncbi:hypothetical protein KBA41_18785 [Candidatus Ozemobacteraceae bacterium]|nr:hypothetical protein [Candidatus Ozemobacteraceae bacterium]